MRLLLAPLALALPLLADTHLTLFVASDPHYGGNYGATADSNRVRAVARFNNLPDSTLPSGAPVGEPFGCFMQGDLIDWYQASFWSAYTADYAITEGTGNVDVCATYDGLGNHDFQSAEAFGSAVTFSTRDSMIIRNQGRTGITMFDTAFYHYVIKEQGVHLINLNVYAGGSEAGWDNRPPMNSLPFLKTYLADSVGESGEPIVLFMHYGVNDDISFPFTRRQYFADAIRGYNVVLIVHGHSHVRGLHTWFGYDVYDTGTIMLGDYGVVQIRQGVLELQHWVEGAEWAPIYLLKTISMGTPSPEACELETSAPVETSIFERIAAYIVATVMEVLA